MTGGDKILNHIKADCDEKIKAFELECNKENELLIEQGKQKALQVAKAINKSAKVKAEHIKAAAFSNAELEVRNSLLQTRRKEIDQTFNAVVDYLVGLSDKDYFDVIYSLIKKVDNKNGEIMFNKKDLKRLPSDFEQKVKACGMNVTISKNTADIIGGFIIINGNIEENMDFSAVLADKRDDIEDLINRELFAH